MPFCSCRACCTYIIRSVGVAEWVHVGEFGFVSVAMMKDKAAR